MAPRPVKAAAAAAAVIVSVVVIVVVAGAVSPLPNPGGRDQSSVVLPAPASTGRPSAAPPVANGLIAVALWNEECGGTECFTEPAGVVLARPDGRAARRLPLRNSLHPQFSANGRFLAVEVDAFKESGIALARASVLEFGYVDRDHEALYEGMDWSPRADQLVFAKTRLVHGHPTRLIRVSARTGRRLTLGTGTWPAWSPNGRWIAFVDVAGDALQVMVVRADGGGRRTLTHFRDDPPRSSRVTVARWSADGRKVLFRRAVWRPDTGYVGSDKLFVVNVGTGRIARVAEPRQRKGLVSPDARLRATDDAGGVYVARRDGTNRRRIMGPPREWRVAGYTLADWQRVP